MGGGDRGTPHGRGEGLAMGREGVARHGEGESGLRERGTNNEGGREGVREGALRGSE